MDVEVVWHGAVVGRLCDVGGDWPHYHGRWEPAGATAFEEAFRDAQAGLAAGEVAVWDAAFRTPGGDQLQPVRLVVMPGRGAPRFRFGGPGPTHG